MHGYLKDYRIQSAAYGWLNPYFTRTGNGDSIPILLQTSFQEVDPIKMEKENSFDIPEKIKET